MPLLCDFPLPPVAREAFAGGFSDKGTALLTFDELEQYSSGKGARRERCYKCPFCGDAERAFHVNIETGAFNCKRSSCGVKGRLREFWPAFENASLNALGARVRGRARVVGSALTLSPEKPVERTSGGNWRALWDNALALDEMDAQPGRDYLCGRGVCIETATRAKVRFCRNWAPSTEGKPYCGGVAILFPLLDRAGDLVAVGGRYLAPRDGQPKARTGGDACLGVFRGTPDALESEQPVLVEGPFDALALASCGVPALALNGVALPVWMPSVMAFKAPWIAPDGDVGGDMARGIWKREISPFAPRLRDLRPDGGKDFGECIQRDGVPSLRAWLQRVGVLPETSDAAEVRELARAILECRRNDGRGPGFDFGLLRPYWRAANELTGRVMDSPTLATWACGVREGDQR